MGNWKTCQLGDLITFQRGHDLPKSKMQGNTYPVVGSNGIIGYHNEYTTEAPSITIGRSGNVGSLFYIKGEAGHIILLCTFGSIRMLIHSLFTTYFKHLILGTMREVVQYQH